jgi:hypothetical protein
MFGKGEYHSVVDGTMGSTKTFSITQPPAAFKIEEEGRVRYVTNPNAENLENLKGGEEYYQLQVDSWVNSGEAEKADSLFCLLDAPTKSGQAVWPTFNHRRHVAFQKIEPLDEVPLIIGFDTSGIHPAAVFLQAQQGRWCVTDELYGDEVGLDSFLHSALVPLVRGRYPRCDITVSVDPANARDSFNALAPSTVLKEVGFKVVIPKTNSVKVRIEAVSVMLNQELGGLMVSPHCERLVDALDGGSDERGYHFRRLRISGSLNVAYSATPEKNEASHIADALQYACLHINQLRNSRAENDPGLVLWRERDNRRRQILVA